MLQVMINLSKSVSFDVWFDVLFVFSMVTHNRSIETVNEFKIRNRLNQSSNSFQSRRTFPYREIAD